MKENFCRQCIYYSRSTNIEPCKSCLYTESLPNWVSAEFIMAEFQRIQAENTQLREERRFIPVSERLPEDETPVEVLVKSLSKSHPNPIILHAQLYLSEWRYSWDMQHYIEFYITQEPLSSIDNVTHWRPLPEPPEEVE